MEIVRIENAQEFDAFVRSHPKGHMMQTSAWGKVKKEWEWVGFIKKNDAGAIVGTCAVLLRSIPMMPYKMMYAPRGPVCDLADKETVKELLLAAKEYGVKNKAVTLKLIPIPSLQTKNTLIFSKISASPSKTITQILTPFRQDIFSALT